LQESDKFCVVKHFERGSFMYRKLEDREMEGNV